MGSSLTSPIRLKTVFTLFKTGTELRTAYYPFQYHP